ncbi:MAG TPA: hypothetical protein VHA13_04665, partial [Gammaproteobacteria bacterium]|nr:hypothetical protein [Gammaproteobacteria bacterium]
AATHALVDILESLTAWDKYFILHFSTLIGLIAWAPSALLFANSTQLVAAKIYMFFSNLKRQLKNIDSTTIGLLIFSLCSGAAYSQMVIVFFNPDMNIPWIFKHHFFQHYLYPILVPLAFLASGSVNYCALENMFVAVRSKNK